MSSFALPLRPGVSSVGHEPDLILLSAVPHVVLGADVVEGGDVRGDLALTARMAPARNERTTAVRAVRRRSALAATYRESASMRIMVVASQKGGGGKTAVTCQQAYYLAELGAPTLLLDLDAQMNATHCMVRGGVAVVAGFSSTQVFEGQWSALPEGDLVLVPADQELGGLERQPQRHNDFVNALAAFLREVAPRFAVCLIDTHPSPDVRYVAALATADLVLSPIVLTQEALEGVGMFLHHPRHGYLRIKQRLNPRLELIGLLPNMVEATLFQRANLRQLVERHPGLLIPVRRGEVAGHALIPTRTAIAEAQAAGVPLWRLRQAAPAGAVEGAAGGMGAMPLRSAARDAWREIRPSFEAIARRLGVGG